MSMEDVEFPCPACGTVNRIAEALVPPNGEIRCGHCGETVALTTPNSGSKKRRGASSLPPASLADPEMDTGTLVVSGEESMTSPQEHLVCCPECGHSFDPADAAQSRRRVLIVEDTDFFLQLASDVLGQRFTTVAVRTVAEARQVLATSPIHLVVLDLTLPDAEGTEVLRALPRRDIPVLIYTSRDETSLIGPEWEALTSLGASDVIHKGINIEEALLQKAEELLAAETTA